MVPNSFVVHAERNLKALFVCGMCLRYRETRNRSWLETSR
jgi:hypothetical protein